MSLWLEMKPAQANSAYNARLKIQEKIYAATLAAIAIGALNYGFLKPRYGLDPLGFVFHNAVKPTFELADAILKSSADTQNNLERTNTNAQSQTVTNDRALKSCRITIAFANRSEASTVPNVPEHVRKHQTTCSQYLGSLGLLDEQKELNNLF